MGNVSPNRATLTSVDAPSPPQSNIAQDAATLIRDLPGIRRNAEGKPIVVFQATVFVQARSKINGAQTGFPLIGMTPGFPDYQPELHITAGRMYKPGLRELIASNKCVRQYTDFGVGAHAAHARWRLAWWSATSISRAPSVWSSRDGDTILSAFGRNTYNQANVMLRVARGVCATERCTQGEPGAAPEGPA